MEKLTITTTAPKAVASEKKPEGWELSIEVDSPETPAEWEELLGADQLCAYAMKQYRIDHQNVVRRMAEAGKDDAEILSTMANWKPGDKVEIGGDPIQMAKKAFSSLSPEARQALLAEYAAM